MSAETKIMSVTGELTIASAAELRELFVDGSIDREGVVDLSGVEACDVAGLQLLCSLRKTAAERGVGIRLSKMSPTVTKTAAAIGLGCVELFGEVLGADSEL